MSVRHLPPDLAEKARVELNEDPKRLPSDIQHLKDWLAKQPHLKARTDDQWLVAFLRGCKYSLERAKEKIDLFYAIHSTAPELFRINHKNPRFFEILDLGSIIFIPSSGDLTKPKICLVRPGAYDANKYNIMEIMSVSLQLQKIMMWEDDQAIVSGVSSILDLDNVTMTHFLQMTPMVMKKMVVTSQDATPFRVKGTHYLNTPPGFEVVFNAMKVLLNEKNRSRLYVHNKNYEEMYKVIPREQLPTEYGGNAGSIKDITDYWKKKVQEYSAFLDEDLQYGSDELKRPGKPKTAETMFGVEGSFRQLEIRALSPELAEKARIELNEDPKKVKDDIQHLKEWCAKQPHLRARIDDQWLLVFLRGCKFSLERAKKKIDLYYTFRSAAPEFFVIKHNHPKFLEVLNLGAMVVLPKTWGPDTPLITIVRFGKLDPNKYNVLDFAATSTIIQKIVLYENDNASVAGIRGVMDMEGTSMAHFMQMTPMLMKKMTVFSQDAMPIRMKGFHYLNTPPGFETVFNFMKGFLNEKNKSRLFVHNKNYEEMYKVIPKDILPAEYGGNGGTLAEIIEYWKNKVQQYSDWLDEEENFGVDESKRPGKPKTAEELFGVEGSFRQLEFD
ncbi:uncharacterized protein LOC106143093 [Amyelois transitella]|uniref:uncharacterized protein LOC106143093 n=1 Tax=Amyelois transitella TaxID=680683 RepID=UPI002990498E|nr:uncharacterized protein LOC106143093 [Amyelois transitella]